MFKSLSRTQIILIVLIVLGTFVSLLNQTIITPALPSIMRDLSVDATTAQWLTTGFTLVNAVMIPVTAFLIDRFSVKVLFSTALAVFAFGSALAGFSGLASSFAVLLTGRLIQAAGAGIMMPLGMTVLLRTFPVEKRGTAMGLFGLVIAFAPAIGPTVAGAVVDSIGWDILFYFIAGLILIVCLLSVIFLKRDTSDCKDVKLDILSVILSSVGFGAFLFGLSSMGSTDSSGMNIQTILGIVIGAIVLVFFFHRQIVMDTPMLQVRVLTNRRYLISVIVVMLVQAALMGASILLPIFMQTDLGFTALESGLVMLPGAIITGIMSPVSGILFDRYGPRVLGIVGMIITTGTTAAFMFLTSDTTLVFLMVLYAFRMLGMALVNMPINTWGMNALPNSLINHGTSVVNTFRQVAGSFGTAILVSVYSLVMSGNLESAGEIQASIDGVNMAFVVSTILNFIGLILVIFFVRNKPAKRDEADLETQETDTLETIMNKNVYGISDDATVLEAMEEMVSKGINAAPLIDKDGKAVGFISDGDIIRYISKNSTEITDVNTMITYMIKTGDEDQPIDKKIEDLLEMPVKGVATNKVIGVDVDSSLVEVCRVMSAHRLKKVPVLKDGEMVGIVSRSDILADALNSYKKQIDKLESGDHSSETAALEAQVDRETDTAEEAQAKMRQRYEELDSHAETVSDKDEK